nr:PREDICTED: syntenin-1-like [Bemisia tabaci]XP_018902323.1 PREDICTED: syntenin-1-like [Bemisia tabaci]
MSLYPSLEDLKVDQLASAQYAAAGYGQSNNTHYGQVHHASAPSAPLSTAPMYPTLETQSAGENGLPYPVAPTLPPPYVSGSTHLYPTLDDYMGLDVSPEALSQNMPKESFNAVMTAPPSAVATKSPNNMVAPISGDSAGLQRAKVTHGIREVVLCKDEKGKVGIRVCAVNKGVFVCLVDAGSPAARVGIKFGDQILQINGELVAGYTMEQVHGLFKKAPVNGIRVVLRDRPFERTVTLHKDSTGHLGFQFKNGEIIGLVIDSSAARNGLLTEHHLLEVDGQNVVGMKDKEISSIIEKASNVVTVTIIPSYVYNHIVKKMAPSLLKTKMDHSVASF